MKLEGMPGLESSVSKATSVSISTTLRPTMTVLAMDFELIFVDGAHEAPRNACS